MRLPSFRRGDAPRGEDVPPVRRSEYLSLALVVLAAFVSMISLSRFFMTLRSLASALAAWSQRWGVT